MLHIYDEAKERRARGSASELGPAEQWKLGDYQLETPLSDDVIST